MRPAVRARKGGGLSRALLTALLVAVGSPGPARRFVPEPYGAAGAVECANGLRIDSSRAYRADDRIPAGRVVVAALRRPVDSDALEALRRAGLEPLAGVFPQSVVCRAARELAGLAPPCALWLAPLPPAAKLAPDLAASGAVQAVAALWPGGDLRTDDIEGLGARLTRVGARTVEFECPADRLAAVAALDRIAWIQPRAAAAPFNDNVQWVLQRGWLPEAPPPETATPVWNRGIRGQGMVIGLFDSGIRTEHDMFRDDRVPITQPGIYPGHRKVVAYKLYRNAAFSDHSGFSYHGTAVAGCLAASDSATGGLSKFDGFAPDARIYFVDNGTAIGTYVFDPDLTELLDSVRYSLGMDDPVKQSSGSFGTGDALGYYRLEEASTDAVLWADKWFTLAWAAGNFGRGIYNIGHPSCAKNLLTVGACENGTDARLVASFTSRGPTRDQRVKPELLSPGRNVWTAYGDSVNSYRSRSGTSFSTPGVSAALALIRQYLRDGWHPLGRPEPGNAWPRASSALLRALAVAGAEPDVGTDFVPNKDVGWGRLNLGRLLHFEGDSIELDLFEDTVGIATGELREYEFVRVARQPLRVVLCWTDTAAALFPAAALVNDLDLELVSPDGNRYRGNQLYAGQSAANPPLWDERNTIEVCLLDVPLDGRWTVRVLARNVYTERQPYAVAVRTGPVPQSGIADARPAPLLRRSVMGASPRVGLLLEGPGRLTVYAADGRAAARLSVAPGPSQWPWTDGAGRPLPAGVYAVRFEPLGRPAESFRSVVVR